MTAEDAHALAFWKASSRNPEQHNRFDRILATYHALAASQQDVEASRQRLDCIVRRVHFALAGECPAYPKSAAACDPMMCDCLSPAQDCTAEQTVELLVDYVARLRASLADAQRELSEKIGALALARRDGERR